MLKILIVYEEIPESFKVYAVAATSDEWKWMQLTHGHYVNMDHDTEETEEACNKLSVWLEDKDPINGTIDDPRTSGPILMRGENYDYVLITGFLL